MTDSQSSPVLSRQRSIPKRLKTFEIPRIFESAKQKLFSSFNELIEKLCDEISNRSDQAGILIYANCEQALLEHLTQTESSRKLMQDVCDFYGWNFGVVRSQLDTFRTKTNVDWKNVMDILDGFKSMAPEARELLPAVATYLKHLLVIPCSSAGAERSFSMLRRIKSCLRSSMNQERLNHCCILSSYGKDVAGVSVDKLSIDSLMKDFVSKGNRDAPFGSL
ncbi:hypothetical protein Ocin01_15336 [Orchesella cincta]|uniref:HAT C-terminal dimerisation domain-containing protein n=1 Tax=Orchesella cincta TaxID=48709 RepID=A0A1D2MEJ0_ORCCI|nr:hypothetical protein Ocin01_15336 [Orchesella cincta]